MQPKSPVTARTLREFRASVTARRKMASLRVSMQRRRLQRIAQPCANNSGISTEPRQNRNLLDRPVGEVSRFKHGHE